MAHKTYAFISDGGIQEEISQGAGRIAGTLGLANLIMFYDSNNIQLSTKVDEVTHEDTAKKYEAGMAGHHHRPQRCSRNPSGPESGTGRKRTSYTHHRTHPDGERSCRCQRRRFLQQSINSRTTAERCGASFENTVANLGGDPQNPFVIFPDVQEYYAQVLEEKRAQAKQKKAEQAAWEKPTRN